MEKQNGFDNKNERLSVENTMANQKFQTSQTQLLPYLKPGPQMEFPEKQAFECSLGLGKSRDHSVGLIRKRTNIKILIRRPKNSDNESLSTSF